MEKSADVQTALEAADVAAAISREYYRKNLAVTLKDDRTPVTDADIACERAIREVLLGAYPDDGFYGEETGKDGTGEDRLWLVDPIDGTKAFIRQYPFFSTQIALMRDGELVLGVSCSPMFAEVAWAERGTGAWLNDERVYVSDIESPAEAAISAGNLKSLASSETWIRYGEIVAASDRIRGYGDFYHYHLLASGRIDAVIESDVNILDIAALSVIVEEAGGVFTDLRGARPGLGTTSVLAANPGLHAELLRRLSA